ncbi:RNA ligase [uncultured archaeon]|nr:RNA ligase [uncultured archaeon]
MTDQLPSFVKYPKIPYLGGLEVFPGEISLFEKIDGSNCQIRNVKGRILLGNRSNFVMNRRWDQSIGYKAWIPTFKRWAMKNYSLYGLPQDVVLFGEWVAPREEESDPEEPHSRIEYSPEFENRLFLIDVGLLNAEGNLERFLDYQEAVQLLRERGIEDVPALPELRVAKPNKRDIERLLVEGLPGKFAKGDMEGIVFKDYRVQSAGDILARKWLLKPYSEISHERELSPNDRYSTTPRIRKTYYKLLEQGLEETDISSDLLFHAVREDIIREANTNPGEYFLSSRIKRFMKTRI